MATPPDTPPPGPDPRDRRLFSATWLVAAAVIAALATLGIAALLTNIFERQQEARNPFYRVVELNDSIVDPAVWGKNFPIQYDLYNNTVDMVRTRYGGSEAMVQHPVGVEGEVTAEGAPPS